MKNKPPISLLGQENHSCSFFCLRFMFLKISARPLLSLWNSVMAALRLKNARKNTITLKTWESSEVESHANRAVLRSGGGPDARSRSIRGHPKIYFPALESALHIVYTSWFFVFAAPGSASFGQYLPELHIIWPFSGNLPALLGFPDGICFLICLIYPISLLLLFWSFFVCPFI